MAAPRLPFLWPMLYKPTAAPRIRYTKSVTSPCKHRTFATTHRRPDEATTQRYGKAHQPAAHLREQEAPKPAESATGSKAILEKTPAQEAHSEASEKAAATQPKTPSQPSALDSPTPSPSPLKPSAAKPSDSVLYMPSPQDPSHHKPPHLKTPPYVHHFDTYGLVRELTRSSYTTAQSTTLMKAVRSLLQSNMTLARDGLVSKSSVENSTYLFRAASSELATEMGNSRKGEIERMRAERAQLRHEVDILGQRLGQETGALREEVKGLFDDRKMSVRMEQRGMETKIQELNYKITISLNSDARSEVEGLRWVLTRRAAITVGVSAFMLFVALRYTSYVQHQRQEEQRRKHSAPSRRDPPVDESTQTPAYETLGGEVLAGEGVSLG